LFRLKSRTSLYRRIKKKRFHLSEIERRGYIFRFQILFELGIERKDSEIYQIIEKKISEIKRGSGITKIGGIKI